MFKTPAVCSGAFGPRIWTILANLRVFFLILLSPFTELLEWQGRMANILATHDIAVPRCVIWGITDATRQIKNAIQFCSCIDLWFI